MPTLGAVGGYGPRRNAKSDPRSDARGDTMTAWTGAKRERKSSTSPIATGLAVATKAAMSSR